MLPNADTACAVFTAMTAVATAAPICITVFFIDASPLFEIIY
jgi:hypothetical protein